MKAVCKQWNSIAGPIQDAKVSPLLMTTRPGRAKDLVEVYDPVSEKKYRIKVRIPDSGLRSQGSQLLHFTKNGWVIMSRGDDHMFFLVNPFKNYPDGGDVIALPRLELLGLGLKGLSFSSVPGSPDFVVLAAGTTPAGGVGAEAARPEWFCRRWFFPSTAVLSGVLASIYRLRRACRSTELLASTSPLPDAAGRRIWPELLKVKVVPYQIEDGVSDARWRFLGAEFCRLPVRQGSPSVPGL